MSKFDDVARQLTTHQLQYEPKTGLFRVEAEIPIEIDWNMNSMGPHVRKVRRDRFYLPKWMATVASEQVYDRRKKRL